MDTNCSQRTQFLGDSSVPASLANLYFFALIALAKPCRASAAAPAHRRSPRGTARRRTETEDEGVGALLYKGAPTDIPCSIPPKKSPNPPLGNLQLLVARRESAKLGFPLWTSAALLARGKLQRKDIPCRDTSR